MRIKSSSRKSSPPNLYSFLLESSLKSSYKLIMEEKEIEAQLLKRSMQKC